MHYQKEQLREISFPLGGIGTGSVGLAGNGRLVDWEIFNRPNKGSLNGYSHIAVRARQADGTVNAKVLMGDFDGSYMGQYNRAERGGYGFGPDSKTMCGFPHFKECTFTGEFPLARLDFADADFPAKAELVAWNPFIPLDSDNSSIPAAFFEVRLTNTQPQPLQVAAAFSVGNPFPCSRNRALEEAWRGVRLQYDGMNPADPRYGELALACTGEAAVQPYWYRGGWQDGIATFWREFASGAPLRLRDYNTAGSHDMASLLAQADLAPGETRAFRFVLSWHVPNNYNYWNPLKTPDGKDVTWKNYYATQFTDAADSARYALEHWDSLWERTLAFHDALFSSTLDAAVLDAASAALSVLKSPTVLRLEDGSFYGWEGVEELTGSCEGTCSHVWNYAYALCFLFPDLERSIRDLEFRYNTYESGEMDFRLKLPLGREKAKFRACVDGQMGAVIKTYREWKLSGDDKWLADNWETVEKILSYAWSPENQDEWDPQRSGVLTGRQHHTLDMELFGPSSWLEGFYLAALQAAARMARHLGKEQQAADYEALYEAGRAWTKEHLFNGKYFIQQVDLQDKDVLEHFGCTEDYWNGEAQQIKYQIGEGCAIDQLCAQWHANICGLGELFDRQQVQTALHSLYQNNFKPSMRAFTNPWRVFALNDESGAVICDYPAGADKPAIPIPYCEEAMHGFEYQLAGLLVSEGMVEEGMTLVRAVRARYNGKKRNPWNEMECGSNYARSMASFALLPLLSGFTFDLPHQMLGFDPKVHQEQFRCLWSVGTGWGTFASQLGRVCVALAEGTLCLRVLHLPFAGGVKRICIDGKDIPFDWQDGTLSFAQTAVQKTVEVELA